MERKGMSIKDPKKKPPKEKEEACTAADKDCILVHDGISE